MIHLPEPVRALLALLRREDCTLPEGTWRDVLSLADKTGCTLFLRQNPSLPAWVQVEIEARFEKNRQRRNRLAIEYDAVAQALRSQPIDFVLLKGFTHEAGFDIDGRLRVQYDLDLLCSPQQIHRAREALQGLGYQPHGKRELSDLHERPLLKPSPWQWRDDYYDPEMPLPVELHTCLWSGIQDRLPLSDLDAPFTRRVAMQVDARDIPALAEADRVAFAALHVLRHVLHNNARISHAWELARMLETRSEDTQLWEAWAAQNRRLRQLQVVAFRFAVEWFRCPWPELLEREWRQLDPHVHAWFRDFAFAPAVNLITPDKHVVLLHRALVEGRLSRLALLLERFVPMKVPAHPGRILYHTRALLAAAGTGLRPWRRAASSKAPHTSD